jgi:hypothetical protein
MEEEVLFIGTQFSNLSSAVDTSAAAACNNNCGMYVGMQWVIGGHCKFIDEEEQQARWVIVCAHDVACERNFDRNLGKRS